ncbi:hypothetical protein D9M68_830070 [compost metagenome]
MPRSAGTSASAMVTSTSLMVTPWRAHSAYCSCFCASLLLMPDDERSTWPERRASTLMLNRPWRMHSLTQATPAAPVAPNTVTVFLLMLFSWL